MSTEENKALVRRWVAEAWNNGNFTEADAMYSANYVLHDPAGPVHGSEGLKQFIAMYRSSFPDLHFTLEDVVAEGNMVAWRYTASGTHKGDLMGIPPTGKQIRVTGIVVSRFVNSKWEEDWVNNDTLGLLQQLGAIPTQG